MTNKLLTDVARMFAELNITFQEADDIAETLRNYFDTIEEQDEWADVAGNAIAGGECSC
jgi:hypothetical protein